MRKQIQTAAACFLAACFLFTGGCIQAVRTGAADGINSAISAIVETAIVNAFAPLTDAE